ncbi:MAG TPA: YfiR family protein [Terracidiphilus sp.]|nr:YfiR family protein [Terracidiphilus sp.]
MNAVALGNVCKTRVRQVVCLLIALEFVGPICLAQSNADLAPSDIEASYLYNFGKFVRWPNAASSAQPFFVCILGQDVFGRKLDDLVARDTIQNRKIVAKRIASPSDAADCQIIFIPLSEDARLKDDLDALAGKPILTVSDNPQFLDRGGMIQFVLQDRRVRFLVNLAAAQRNGLALDSELLKVAMHVITEPVGEAQP